jgi:hypothetical protein
MKDGLDHLFMLPGEAAEEDGDIVTLRPGKGALNRLLKLPHARQACFRAKTCPFRIDASLNLHLKVGLNDLFYWHMPLLLGCVAYVVLKTEAIGATAALSCPGIRAPAV